MESSVVQSSIYNFLVHKENHADQQMKISVNYFSAGNDPSERSLGKNLELAGESNNVPVIGLI